MFLNELEKDKSAYIEKAKNLAEKYITNFFGDEYKDKISKRLLITPLFFVDRKNVHYNYNIKVVDQEIGRTLCKWLDLCNLKFDEEVHFDEFTFEALENVRRLIFSMNYLNKFDSIKAELDIVGENNFVVDKAFADKLRENYEKIEQDLDALKRYKTSIEIYKNVPPKKIFELDSLVKDETAKTFTENANISFYCKAIERINKFLYNQNTDATTCALYTKNDDTNTITKFCVYDNVTKLTNLVFIHELLHAISASVSNQSKNLKEYKDGISLFSIDLNNHNTTDKYDYFNEVITEIFAVLIYYQMVDNNETVFYNFDKSTSYIRSFKLIEPLFTNNIEKFKRFYLSDKNEIEKYFGADNLNIIEETLKIYSKINNKVEPKYQTLSFEESLEIAKNKTYEKTELNQTYFNCYKIMNSVFENIKKNNKDDECIF